jgi:hypothetical protein
MDNFSTAGQQIDQNKAGLLNAAAMAGTQGKLAFEAAQKSLQEGKAAAAKASADRWNAMGAGQAAKDQAAGAVAPFERQLASTAQLNNLNNTFRGNLAASSNNFMSNLKASMPAVQAAAAAAATKAGGKQKELTNELIKTEIGGATRNKLDEIDKNNTAALTPAEEKFNAANKERDAAKEKLKQIQDLMKYEGHLEKPSIGDRLFRSPVGGANTYSQQQGDAKKNIEALKTRAQQVQADLDQKQQAAGVASLAYDNAKAAFRTVPKPSTLAQSIAQDRGVGKDRAAGIFGPDYDTSEMRKAVSPEVVTAAHKAGISDYNKASDIMNSEAYKEAEALISKAQSSKVTKDDVLNSLLQDHGDDPDFLNLITQSLDSKKFYSPKAEAGNKRATQYNTTHPN